MTAEDAADDEVLYRNEPTHTFAAHLFGADDVHDAGGGPDDQSDRPVVTICGQQTSYGAFHPATDEVSDAEIVARGRDPSVDARDTDATVGGNKLCGWCAAAVADHLLAIAPVDPTELTVDDLRGELAARDLSALEARVVRVLERAGDDRTTAIEAIDRVAPAAADAGGDD